MYEWPTEVPAWTPIEDADPQSWMTMDQPSWPSVIPDADVADGHCIEWRHEHRTAHLRCWGCAIDRAEMLAEAAADEAYADAMAWCDE